jgi:hypothetical protein
MVHRTLSGRAVCYPVQTPEDPEQLGLKPGLFAARCRSRPAAVSGRGVARGTERTTRTRAAARRTRTCPWRQWVGTTSRAPTGGARSGRGNQVAS